jgi:predicted dehydrogenase
VIGQQGRSFTHGFEIYLERATLSYDFSVVDGMPRTNVPLTLFLSSGKVVMPKLPEADGFVAELTEAIRAIRGGQVSDLLSGELALDALALCHREIESVLKARPVKTGENGLRR